MKKNSEKRKLCLVIILLGLMFTAAPFTVAIIGAGNKGIAIIVCSLSLLLILIPAMYGLYWMED